MKRLRVLISYDIPYPRFDGVSNLLSNLHKYYLHHNIDVLLLYPHSELHFGTEYPEYESIKLRGVSLPGYRDCKFGLPQFSIDRIIDDFSPNLIHTLAPFALGLSVISAGKRRRIPTLGTFTTNIPEYVAYYKLGFIKSVVWKIFRSIHNKCDVNLAPSATIKVEMEKHGIMRSALWGRGVDSQRFSPKNKSKAFRTLMTNGHPERRIILYVGRLSLEKNLDQIFDAANGLKDTHIVVVGDGPLRKNLERIFSGQNVTFMGFLEGELLSAAYSSADVFVIPSLTEGFANVVLESMASGVPVVGFESNGVSDLILESKAGLIAQSHSSNALRNAILTLLDNTSLREKLSLKAREFALTKNWQSCFDDLMIFYNDLLDNPLPHKYAIASIDRITEFDMVGSQYD